MIVTRAWRLYLLGVVMWVTLFIWAWYRGKDGAPLFLLPLVVAGLTYLAAIRELSQTANLPRAAIFICLALSVLWRVPFLVIPAGPRDDLHRYVWDGRVQRLGYDPYTTVPADQRLANLHTLQTRGLNNPDVPSLYPAGAELFFRAVTAIRESTAAFKLVLVGCDLVLVFVLFCALRQNGQEHWVLAYAWHPLLATEVAGGGHIDILGILLLVISAIALGRRSRPIAAVAFALAFAVKLLPIVLAPLYWRRLRVRDALLAASVVVLLYLPFLGRAGFPLDRWARTSNDFVLTLPSSPSWNGYSRPTGRPAWQLLWGS